MVGDIPSFGFNLDIVGQWDCLYIASTCSRRNSNLTTLQQVAHKGDFFVWRIAASLQCLALCSGPNNKAAIWYYKHDIVRQFWGSILRVITVGSELKYIFLEVLPVTVASYDFKFLSDRCTVMFVFCERTTHSGETWSCHVSSNQLSSNHSNHL